MPGSASRQRYLRRQSERRKRTRLARGPAEMRFLCSSCGARYRSPVNLTVGPLSLIDQATGQTFNLSTANARWSIPCPQCGERADATNSVNVVAPDGLSITGFADTAAQVRAIEAAIDDLRKLEQDSSLDQIIEVLERQGPSTRPVAEYLRANQVQLAQLGIGLLTAVIMLLQWLHPFAAAGDEAPMPAGITKHQMDQLLHDFERATRSQATDGQRPADCASQAGRDDDAVPGSEGTDSRRGANPRQ